MYHQGQQEDAMNKTQVIHTTACEAQTFQFEDEHFNSSQNRLLMTELRNEPPAPKATCPLELLWLPVRLLKEELKAQIPARTIISCPLIIF